MLLIIELVFTTIIIFNYFHQLPEDGSKHET